MRFRLPVLATLCVAVAVIAATQAGTARAASKATYYLSLGDSLAQGYQPIGGPPSNAAPPGYNQGYADQLFKLERDKYTQLRLVKLGCGGESTVSMRYGSQPSSLVLSCGSPSYYEHQYPDGGTQLAEAVAFLREHRGSVAFVTIDAGANDLSRVDAEGVVITCLFEAAGCDAQQATMVQNLAAILAELRAAAGPGVPIVGMTYYDVFAPLCVSDPSQLFVCGRADAVNALAFEEAIS
jgi:lysophospholipase L1-like esterase